MLQRILGNLGHALGRILSIIWPPIAETIGWIFFGDGSYLTTPLFIKNHVIPFYDKLEAEYGAKYPTIMEDPVCYIKEFPYKKDLTLYFFVKDEAFVIVRETDPSFHIVIPFSDILCQYCSYFDSLHQFLIKINFLYNGKKEHCAFSTLSYNHKLDKKYGNRLTGEELFLFIRDNFIDEDEYKKIHGYNSLP